jgi:hypothetical protein
MTNPYDTITSLPVQEGAFKMSDVVLGALVYGNRMWYNPIQEGNYSAV